MKMKVSLLKKLGAVVCCAAVLCSSMLMGASAADNRVNLKNLVLYPSPVSYTHLLYRQISNCELVEKSVNVDAKIIYTNSCVKNSGI